MLNIARDIQSLSHFKRNTSSVVRKMRKSGSPLVLTVNGKAELVVQDAASFQKLVELAERAEMMGFLAKAKADADAGRTLDARNFVKSLGKKAKRA